MKFQKNECSVCHHPKRLEIELALRNKASILGLEKTYGIGHTTLSRHRQHMDEPKPFDEKSSIERIGQMEKVARSLMARAVNSGDVNNAIKLINSANALIQTSAKLKGELSGKPADTTEISWAKFNGFVDALLAALDKDPNAKKAVMDALGKMEDYEENFEPCPVDPPMG
jgi:hypothetical protein